MTGGHAPQEETKDCGDVGANAHLVPLVKAGLAMPEFKVKINEKEKTFKDRMAWTRDQVHLLRRLQKEVTGRLRSLRFFENVRTLQRENLAAAPGAAAAPKPGHEVGLLSCCGHMGEIKAVRRAAVEQLCVEAEKGCKAPARSSCVIAVSELGAETGGQPCCSWTRSTASTNPSKTAFYPSLKTGPSFCWARQRRTHRSS